MSLLWFIVFVGCFGECAEMIQGGGWWPVDGTPVPFSPFAIYHSPFTFFLHSPFTVRLSPFLLRSEAFYRVRAGRLHRLQSDDHHGNKDRPQGSANE